MRFKFSTITVCTLLFSNSAFSMLVAERIMARGQYAPHRIGSVNTTNEAEMELTDFNPPTLKDIKTLLENVNRKLDVQAEDIRINASQENLILEETTQLKQEIASITAKLILLERDTETAANAIISANSKLSPIQTITLTELRQLIKEEVSKGKAHGE